MFSSGSYATREHAAILLDIGSGSVGIALLHYDPEASSTTVLWQHREFTGITDTIKQPVAKVIKTALLNAWLEFDSTGRAHLPAHLSSRDITATQVLIGAPWIYTLTKTVTYSQEHSFTITDRLIDELQAAAQADAEQAMQDLANADTETLNLKIIQARPITVVANGYQTTTWENASARTLRIDYLTAISHTTIVDAIEEMHSKIAPKTTLSMHSHMSALYEALRHLHPEFKEIGLVDITTEGTEIGIIRDGVLRHVTAIPQGMYTLAREMSDNSSIPEGETFTYLQKDYEDCTKNAKCKSVIAAYEAALTEAMSKTDDKLLMPKTIYVHSNQPCLTTLQTSIAHALRATTGLTHSVHYLNSEILTEPNSTDTSILISKLYYELQHGRAR